MCDQSPVIDPTEALFRGLCPDAPNHELSREHMLDLVASTWHSVTPDDEQRWSLLKMLPDVEQVRIKIFRFRRQGACPLQGLFDEFHRGKPGYFVDASREMMIDRVAEALPAELTPWQTA